MADGITIGRLIAATRSPPTAHITDDQIVAAVGTNGSRTEVIADKLGVLRSRPAIYRRLLRLEKAGRLRRQERFTFVNSIRWERTDG